MDRISRDEIWRARAIMETEKFKGETVIYRGGHHIVVCDGSWHWLILENGTRERSHKCSSWAGEHAKGTQDIA